MCVRARYPSGHAACARAAHEGHELGGPVPLGPPATHQKRTPLKAGETVYLSARSAPGVRRWGSLSRLRLCQALRFPSPDSGNRTALRIKREKKKSYSLAVERIQLFAHLRHCLSRLQWCEIVWVAGVGGADREIAPPSSDRPHEDAVQNRIEARLAAQAAPGPTL